jgi:solute carrier family 15 (oligopeptide transporter), member 1
MRSDVKCYQNDCFPLAFGIPSVFMFIALIIFFMGSDKYKRDDEIAIKNVKSNIIVETVGCTWHAFKNRFIKRKNYENKDNWIQCADDKYTPQIVKGTQIFFNVATIFLPLIVLWTLYEQQGSKWIHQAQQLDGRFGQYLIKPEQLHIFNPLIIISFIPIMDALVYPFLHKFGLFQTHLKKMYIGFFLVILSFVISAALQYRIEHKFVQLNPSHQIKLINLSPCQLDVSGLTLEEYKYGNNKVYKLPSHILDAKLTNSSATSIELKVLTKCFKNYNQTHDTEFDLIVLIKDLPSTFVFNSNNQSKKQKNFNIFHFLFKLLKFTIKR